MKKKLLICVAFSSFLWTHTASAWWPFSDSRTKVARYQPPSEEVEDSLRHLNLSAREKKSFIQKHPLACCAIGGALLASTFFVGAALTYYLPIKWPGFGSTIFNSTSDQLALSTTQEKCLNDLQTFVFDASACGTNCWDAWCDYVTSSNATFDEALEEDQSKIFLTYFDSNCGKQQMESCSEINEEASECLKLTCNSQH